MVKVSKNLTVIVMEAKEIVKVTVFLKTIHFSKKKMNVEFVTDQVLLVHYVTAPRQTHGLVTEHAVVTLM